ncbi:MAG TPA: glycosyltransferase [Patescibacteria group bacterium]|nr:glycosyltransferase [Patescibacteria group bacterium]
MSTRRIILMYISEVSGHHSATLALENAIKALCPSAEILNINAFNYTNPISEKIVNRIYMGIIKRTPQIWDYLYDNPAVAKRIAKIKATIHKFNSAKFKKLFDRFHPDVVACAQAFPCGMVADFKKLYQADIPLVAVLTDYIPHSYWLYDTIDYYAVPAEEISRSLVLKGVPPEKIKPLGIPFDHKFNEPVSQEKVLRKLGLAPDVPAVLIMGGGQGLGPIKTVIRRLEYAEAQFQQIIVTGSNKKLYRSLKRRIRHHRKKTLLFGYVHNVHELMSVSSLIITKPGGITTAEAMSKALPMVIINPIPGQEASNTAFLTARGAAVKIDNAKDIHLVVDDLLLHPEKLQSMRQAAGSIGKPTASLDIARLLLGLCKKT